MSDQVKQCELCGNSFQVILGRGSSNRISCYSCTNKPKNRAIQYRNKHQKRKYGITQFQYTQIKEDQNNKCKICNVILLDENYPPTKGMKRIGNEPCIDHNHSTGKVRGILCFHCNTALGHAFDNTEILKKMIQYLEEE